MNFDEQRGPCWGRHHPERNSPVAFVLAIDGYTSGAVDAENTGFDARTLGAIGCSRTR